MIKQSQINERMRLDAPGAGGKAAVLIQRGHAAVQRAVSAMAAGCRRSLAAEAEVAAAKSQLADAVGKNKQLTEQVDSLQRQLSLSWEESKVERAAAEAAVLSGKKWERRSRAGSSTLAH